MTVTKTSKNVPAEIRTLIKKLENDSRVLRMHENFSKFDFYNLPIKELKSEIQTLHTTRSMRTLKLTDADFHNSIIEASLHDQAIRSRLTEISLQTYRAEKSLIQTMAALKDYLVVNYSDALAVLKTKEERLRVIDVILSDFAKYAEHAAMIQNMATLIVKDIDQASWSIKSTIEVLKMWSLKEKTI